MSTTPLDELLPDIDKICPDQHGLESIKTQID